MKCTFYRPKRVDVDKFDGIVEKLKQDLLMLENEDVRRQDVYFYVKKLCSTAKPLDHNPKMCFWGLDKPSAMPHDCRVAYFYMPTYYATAFLMKAVLLYPNLIDEKKECGGVCCVDPTELKDVLQKSMQGCTGRDFDGGGVISLAESVKIFVDAGAVEFLEKYPDICVDFKKMFDEKKAMVDRGERPIYEMWYPV